MTPLLPLLIDSIFVETPLCHYFKRLFYSLHIIHCLLVSTRQSPVSTFFELLSLIMGTTVNSVKLRRTVENSSQCSISGLSRCENINIYKGMSTWRIKATGSPNERRNQATTKPPKLVLRYVLDDFKRKQYKAYTIALPNTVDSFERSFSPKAFRSYRIDLR